MTFLIFRGTATRACDDEGSSSDQVHSYICMAATRDLTVALERAHAELTPMGYTIATVDSEPLKLPHWRALLPTDQGRTMRQARRFGVSVVIYTEART